jgi:hypothetical protein
MLRKEWKERGKRITFRWLAQLCNPSDKVYLVSEISKPLASNEIDAQFIRELGIMFEPSQMCRATMARQEF